MANKTVMSLDMYCDKCKKVALHCVTKIEGIDSLSIDMKERTLTVIGDADPVCVANLLRSKFRCAKLLSAGPVPPPQPKEEKATEENKAVEKNQAEKPKEEQKEEKNEEAEKPKEEQREEKNEEAEKPKEEQKEEKNEEAEKPKEEQKEEKNEEQKEEKNEEKKDQAEKPKEEQKEEKIEEKKEEKKEEEKKEEKSEEEKKEEPSGDGKKAAESSQAMSYQVCEAWCYPPCSACSSRPEILWPRYHHPGAPNEIWYVWNEDKQDICTIM